MSRNVLGNTLKGNYVRLVRTDVTPIVNCTHYDRSIVLTVSSLFPFPQNINVLAQNINGDTMHVKGLGFTIILCQ